MRFRAGLLIGFATGYYLGAKAGRERYQQLERVVAKARGSEVVSTAGDKARAVIDLTLERARVLVEHDDEDDDSGVVQPQLDLDLEAGRTVQPGDPSMN
jgi:hypothetical protein